ncbi:IclR family transcriptional regulator [Cryobacterium sp. AP23]
MANGSAGRSVLSRYLDVLGVFDVGRAFLTVSQVSKLSSLPLSTTHRILSELESQKLLERQPDRTYRLGIRLWELACRTPGALGLRELSMPSMQAAHNLIGQHLQLGVLEHHDVLFLERLSTRDAVVNVTLVGGRLPVHASTSGLVLLAHAPDDVQEDVFASARTRFTELTATDEPEIRRLLDRVRRQGFIIGDGFIHPDARGIAVPVFGPSGECIASLAAIVPRDSQPSNPIVRTLLNCAAEIAEALKSAYLPANHPSARPGGRYRAMVNSSDESMRYLATSRKK